MTRSPSVSPVDVEAIAAELHKIQGKGGRTTPLSERFAPVDLPTAYRIAGTIRLLRGLDGETAVGRKIGFTNHKMWQVYDVKAPIWGTMYDSTVRDLAGGAVFSLAGFPEPKIEPEIILGLGATPAAGMDERALLECVDWIALGFEIVQSVYPGWRFDTGDAISAFGLHAALRIGPRHRVAGNPAYWLERLPDFRIVLSRDGEAIAEGNGSDVLGGPLTALRHLNDLLAGRSSGPALAAGEIISTGTLTLAAVARPGEQWRAVPEGIGLEEVSLRFVQVAAGKADTPNR
jgi:2-oxo-3-hexenedioate decarboxylase